MNYYQLVEQITKYNDEQKKHNVYYAIYGEEGMLKKPKLKAIVDKAIGLIEIPAPPPKKRRRHNRPDRDSRGRKGHYYYSRRNRRDDSNGPIKLNLEIEVDVKEKRRGQY